MSDIISKRLHVSGLTPAITLSDLSQRFSTFGTVKALDGFGKLDGLGQPRKFGYVTLEATKPQLARCLNLLSGVTWKGAKLRIGEAKPDFGERIKKEHIADVDESSRPTKRRRLPRGVQGAHSENMESVTPENYKDHSGWRVTPSGRLIRPIRIRPARPLPSPLVATTQPSRNPAQKKKRKRVKAAPTRLRRCTIDPTRWGSEHLKGVYMEEPLDSEVVHASEYRTVEEYDMDDVSEEESQSGDLPGQDALEGVQGTRTHNIVPSAPTASAAPDSILKEKTTTLGLLQSMFGDTEGDWGGAESLGSDIDDVEEDGRDQATSDVDVGDVQEVPTVTSGETDGAAKAGRQPESGKAAPAQRTKLKDLFAPREEEAGFSLLGHLDIELELEDEDVMNDGNFGRLPRPALVDTGVVPTADVRPRADGVFVPDPKLAMFFPLAASERRTRGNVKDLFDVARERGWDWRQTFYRTETEEEIRQRWEEQKVELTRDWKRRHREAVKSRRRRGGADAME